MEFEFLNQLWRILSRLYVLLIEWEPNLSTSLKLSELSWLACRDAEKILVVAVQILSVDLLEALWMHTKRLKNLWVFQMILQAMNSGVVHV